MNILAGLFVESTLPYLVILGIATVVIIATMFACGWKLRVEKEKEKIKDILIVMVTTLLAFLLMEPLKIFGLHPRTAVAVSGFMWIVMMCLIWLYSKSRAKDNKPKDEQKQ